jgi:Fe2+ or Zn2+ uptake regulation protein
VLMTLHNTPRSIEELRRALKGKVHHATVYRSIKELLDRGVLSRVEGPDAVRFEFADEHHHHVICSGCGVVEESDICLPASLASVVLKKSKAFTKISGHSFEFFGTCVRCS